MKDKGVTLLQNDRFLRQDCPRAVKKEKTYSDMPLGREREMSQPSYYEKLQAIGREITREIAEAYHKADDLKLDLLLAEKDELNRELAAQRLIERLEKL